MGNKNTYCHCKRERLSIKLGPFERDERTKYVEHVLDVMKASRYAPDRPYRLLTRIRNEPTVDEPVFYDLTPAGPMPAMEMDYYKEEFIAALARDFVMRRLAAMDAEEYEALASQYVPTTLARGSPVRNRVTRQ